MAEVVKAGVVLKAVEKDDEHATVAPNQYCDVALIPSGARPSRPFKDGWKVTIGRDAVYNPPRNEGLMGGKVTIECGARVNGSVFGRDSVEIESGKSKDRGIIYGTVTSTGGIRIMVPKGKHEKDKVQIIGDLIGKKVRVDAPLIVNGNIVSDEDIDINAETITFGNIYSKGGRIKLKETSANSIIAGNERREEKTEKGTEPIEPKEFGIEIGEKVSLLNPLIWAKNGKIRVVQDVRLMSGICRKCLIERFGINDDVPNLYSALFSCPLFKKGNCNEYRKLVNDDIIDYMSGQIITDAWRTYSETEEEYKYISQGMENAIDTRKDEKRYRELFEVDRWRVATTDDLRPDIKIEQRIEKMFASGEAAAAYGREEAMGKVEEKRVEVRGKVEEKKIEVGLEKEKMDQEFIKHYIGKGKSKEEVKTMGKTISCPTCGMEFEMRGGESICPHCKTAIK